MSRGYLILAQNSKNNDYVRMAYALALSIKNSQSTVNRVCLATDIPLKNLNASIIEVFDSIVSIPWVDHAANSDWKIENKWKYYHMSPFDETVILDADMLIPSDISHWWDIMATQDIWITNKPQTFKGEVITSTKYRNTFVSNNLPNVYTAFMYFKKTQLSAELFALIELIFHNWEHFFYTYLDETRPAVLSGDVAYALAIKLLGIEDDCFGNLDTLPTFVHMKGHLQNINEKFITEDWTKHIPTYFRTDGGFKIGNYEQTLPFHYHIKEWLDDDKLSILEKRVGVK
jgi:hypothetical protein